MWALRRLSVKKLKKEFRMGIEKARPVIILESFKNVIVAPSSCQKRT